MFQKINKWFLGLWLLLSNAIGAEGDDDANKDANADKVDDDDANKDNADDNEDGDAGDDSGKDVGKDRSKYIPRERFDEVNAKAQQVDNLISLGVLTEGEDGEIRINPNALKTKEADKGGDNGKPNFRFTKDEVDDKSWPLVEKINKAYDHYDSLASTMAWFIQSLQAENAILRDYPEFIAKDSPLRKKAEEIMKNDPEFKKIYKGRPDTGYWAVKRANELLSGEQPTKPKPKAGFITGRGDVGKGEKGKPLDLSKMSQADLDKLEQEEHQRLFGPKKK